MSSQQLFFRIPLERMSMAYAFVAWKQEKSAGRSYPIGNRLGLIFTALFSPQAFAWCRRTWQNLLLLGGTIGASWLLPSRH